MDKSIFNKQARFDYEILESFESGISLQGDEVKAVRSGRVNLKGSYAKIFYTSGKPEIFLVGAHFHTLSLDPYRTRKLLAHASEIKHLVGKSAEKRLTIIPLKMYFKRGRVKVEVGIGRGKKEFDKRESIKKRDLDRSARQELADRGK
jgi:SsrA-binding protein